MGVSPSLFSATGLVRTVHPDVARHQQVQTELLRRLRGPLSAAQVGPRSVGRQAGRSRIYFHTRSLLRREPSRAGGR